MECLSRREVTKGWRTSPAWLWFSIVGILLGTVCLVGPAAAQISAGGTPPSWSYPLAAAVPTAQMAPVDNQAERAIDENLPKHERNRFAATLDVSLNLENSGVWENLPNGDRVWRLRISSPTAFSIGLLYDQWYIPKGGELFIYNDDHSRMIGAFTSFNNWVDGTNVTHHVAGDAITLEYYEPAAIRDQSTLSISQVCHAYRNYFGHPGAIDNFGDSGTCNNNVRCPEAANWQDEKHGVTMITSGGTRWCSGSMINTASGPNNAYYLTANHCGFSASWVFVFNYESPQCSPSQDGPTNLTVANATQRANWSTSDFNLVELSSFPPANYTAYYNGWNRVDAASTSSTCIHHPSGDVKKITFDYQAPQSSGYNGPGSNHWRVLSWNDGTTEGGSSGSPLFDQNSRITGQLHGGYASCVVDSPDYFGKFATSWTGGGTNATRLSNWLDPGNTGATTVNGVYRSAPTNDNCTGVMAITSLPYSHTGNTSAASHDYSGTCFSGSAPDVIYSLNLTCSYSVTVSLCGSMYDTGLYVRTGGSCPGSTEVACNDDNAACSNSLNSQLTFTATGGTTYYIVVDGFIAYSGDYSLNVTGTMVPPSNDACPGMAFTSLPFSHSGNTTCAANNYNVDCVYGDPADVVYNMTLSTCQTVTVSLCGSSYDTGLEVRSGGSCPGSTQVACNDDNAACANSLNSQLTFVAQAGVTYYIIVDGYGTYTGAYTLNVTGTAFTAPNDVCPGTTIASLPYTDTGNTLCANNNYTNCYGNASREVIYTYTPTACQTVTVSLCNSGYDTYLGVWTGGSCPGTTQVACDDDGCGYPYSQLSFTAIGGVQYWIRVHGFATQAGPYNLSVTGTPFTSPGDVCPGVTIASLPYSTTGDTRCANNNYTNCVVGSTSTEVIYTYTPTSCQSVTVSLCNSGYDTGLGVYTGGTCPGSTLVACDDDGCGYPYSQLTFTAIAGVQYWIRVHGYQTNAGPYNLSVTGTPIVSPNDVCPGTTIASLPYSDTGDTRCANNNYTNCWGNTSREVIYSYTPIACQTVTVSLCNSGYDTYLGVWTGGSCPGTTQVACDDDGCTGTLYSRLTFTAIAGVQYWIRVHGISTQAGPYNLSVTGTPFTPANDVCPGTTIASLPYTDTGDTRCANNNYDVNCVWGDPADVVYNLTLASCQTVTASLCGSGYDTGIEIRTGGSCPGTTQVACNDDNFCGPNYVLQSTATFVAQAGVTYYVIVDGYDVQTGPFTLNVTGAAYAPPNDNCTSVTPVALPATFTGDNRCATNDCALFPGGQTWHAFTVPANCGRVVLDYCGTSPAFGNGWLNLAIGCPCASNTVAGTFDWTTCGDGNVTVRWCGLAPGVYYYPVLLDPANGAAGPYTINVSCLPPANDACPGTAIAALPYSDNGDTRCATNNYDVTCVDGDPADVVYSLNLATCQNVSVSLCGSGYDTGLAVRSGGTCPGTSEIACNDDSDCGSGPVLQSQVTFTAQAATSYYIIVDGFWTDAGPFTLNVTGTPCVPPPAPTALVIQLNATSINLNWPPVPGAASYRVYRKVTPDVAPVPADFLANAPSNSYTDVGVTGGNPKFFYMVTAMSSGDLLAGLPPQGGRTETDAAYANEKLERNRAAQAASADHTAEMAAQMITQSDLQAPPDFASYANLYTEAAPALSPKAGGTSSSWPTEVDFVPYAELYPPSDAATGKKVDGSAFKSSADEAISWAYSEMNTRYVPNAKKEESTTPDFKETVIVPYANPGAQTAPDFQKKEMPADETLRVENFYLPAYTEFTSRNIPNPNKERMQ